MNNRSKPWITWVFPVLAVGTLWVGCSKAKPDHSKAGTKPVKASQQAVSGTAPQELLATRSEQVVVAHLDRDARTNVPPAISAEESMRTMQERRAAFRRSTMDKQLIRERVALHVKDEALQKLEAQLRQDSPDIKARYAAYVEAQTDYQAVLARLTPDYATLTSTVARLQVEADRQAEAHNSGAANDTQALIRVMDQLNAALRTLSEGERKALAEDTSMQSCYRRVMECRSAYDQALMARDDYRTARDQRNANQVAIENLTVSERMLNPEH
jgi:hypothetical protein